MQAAEILHDKNLYASSVHCSYYACLQKMIEIHLTTLEYTKESIEDEMEKKELSSHKFYIGNIQSKLLNKADFDQTKAANEFKSRIKQLQDTRVKADYYDLEILIDQSSDSKFFAEQVLKILKKYFKK